ncbi:MAG: hypothetical protein RL711_779 [Bacteroidota bacterium]|jgi:uncharacterized protein (TIGR00266 family)
MNSHEVDYKIIGEGIQIVEVELDPNETIIAEAGAMLYMEDNISFEAKMGDGSNPNQGFFGKLLSAGSRLMTGESLFITHFTNNGHTKRRVAFSSPYPGTIIPIDLRAVNQCLLVQKDGFLCAAKGTKMSMAMNRKLGAGFLGGEGFILQRIEGDGMLFMHAAGTVIERYLDNETLRVDTGCIVAFEPQIDMDIQKAGNLKSMFFGGEGMFLATLSGRGRVWLQSMPIDKLIQALRPSGANAGKEQSSILGSFLE